MGAVLLYEDDLETGSAISHCRICHEAEFESCKSLEAPCACSGTAKFAHRDCIQRWCDEKGNTICEICLQKYEPGYTAAAKEKCQPINAMTIRESVEIPTREGEADAESQELVVISEGGNTACNSSADRTTSCCRSLALIFTVLMLTRHLFATLIGGTEDYPFTLATILILRASGILLPMYLIFRTISAILKGAHRRHHYQDCDDNEASNSGDDENQDDHPLQHLV